MSAVDVRYGRQGGRLVPVPGDRPFGRVAPLCSVCGLVVTHGRDCHYSCEPAGEPGDGQLDLFGGADGS